MRANQYVLHMYKFNYLLLQRMPLYLIPLTVFGLAGEEFDEFLCNSLLRSLRRMKRVIPKEAVPSFRFVLCA